MGLLVDGKWTNRWSDKKSSEGRFERSRSVFRNWITPDGTAGPSGKAGFRAEPGRYHLYVSYACPWAHRTLIYRVLKGIDQMIGVSFVHWFMGERGWTFEHDSDGLVGDPLYGAEYLYEIYQKANSAYTGRVTVPILWDKHTETIVSNESSEIIRMFNTAFDDLGATTGDYYPERDRAEIDLLNARIYDTVNNGVYKCGFATTQQAYDEAVVPLFETMGFLETRLSERRFLVGESPTEADWRLFPTLLRFDPVYVGHFKCNLKRLVDYPNLWGYARELFQWPGVVGTINFTHIRRHYYQSHESINPTHIVPIGPEIDWHQPHQRGR